MENPQSLPDATSPLPGVRRFTLLRTAAGTLGLKLGAGVLTFTNGILLARLLGPGQFGVYSIVLSIVTLGAALAVLGLPTLATREAAAYAERGQWAALRGFLRAAHRWTALAWLTLAVICATVVGSGVAGTGPSWAVVVIGMALVLTSALNQLRAAILRGLHWVILASIPDLLLRPAVMLVLLGAATIAAIHARAGDALIFELTAGGVALAAGTAWLLARRPAGLRAAAPETPRTAWLAAAVPFLGIALIQSQEGKVSLYLLGYLAGAREAGLFEAASQIVTAVLIGLAAVNMPLQPRLAAAWARGDGQEAQRLVTETARLGTTVAVAVGLFILFFSGLLLRLFGPEYTQAATALQILTVGAVFNAASGPCGNLLQMTGHQRVVVRGLVLALAVDIAISWLAIPRWGVAGGALGATTGIIFWNVYFVTYGIRTLGLNTCVITWTPAHRPRSSPEG